LRGVEREVSLLEFWWRVGLYTERESRDAATLSAKSIRDLKIKLAHRYITMTITGRKETTNHVTEEDEGDDAEGDREWRNKRVEGSADICRNMSARDWQIDPFPGFEADYPPYGYQEHMPLGYTHRLDPSQDGSS
nr:hypothetical protein [Tanacetum cinerariifolium]